MRTGFEHGGSLCVRAVLSSLLVSGLCSLGGCPPPGGGAGPTLAGTWVGDVAYVVSTTLSGSPLVTANATQATTVTFDTNGKPDTTFIPLVESPMVIAEVPLADLSNVGDAITAPMEEKGVQNTVDVTVTAVSSTATQYHLELSVGYVGVTLTDPLTGSHSLTATLQDDGTVSWESTTTLTTGIGAMPIGTSGTSTGTLVKQ
jgi:hypothetical protein